MPHRKLIHKLQLLGIDGNLLKWIEAFLTNREQRVVLGNHQSQWSKVTSGVPQGSVLGPTLFVAFINDLPNQLSNKCKLYADDAKIVAKVDTLADIISLQNDIDKVTIWCSTWSMWLNQDKFRVMHIGKHNFNNNYTALVNDLNRVVIRQTNQERDLGIILTPDFKFSVQSAHAATKANAILSMLKKTFISRDIEIWATLYRTYVRPHLEFAISAWRPYLKRDIQVIEKVQRRATRIPTALKDQDYNFRLDRMGLTTLETRRNRGDIIELYKLGRGTDKITWVKEPNWSTQYGRKRSQLRRQIVTSCSQRHNFFLNRVANLWNALPDEIVNSTSTDILKSKLDLFL